MFGSRTRSPLIRVWTPFLVLVRILALALGLQFSGAGHLLMDVVSLVTVGEAEHDEQCPVDQPCNDCPPGCPNCHCPSTLRSVPPEATELAAIPSSAPDRLTLRDESRAPSRPELPSLFRPPRIQSLV